jgi:hypothetical protein
MMKVYNVILADEMTVIELEDKSFRMRVYKANEQVLIGETALLEATTYIEQQGFRPTDSYLFELIDTNGIALKECHDIDHFKSAITFFFNTILDTELFVISIPQASMLCPIERKGYNFYKVAG